MSSCIENVCVYPQVGEDYENVNMVSTTRGRGGGVGGVGGGGGGGGGEGG